MANFSKISQMVVEILLFFEYQPWLVEVKVEVSPLLGGRYQVTLCDPIWHVSSEAGCRLLYSIYFLFAR